METKNEIRQLILARREMMPQGEWCSCTDAITSRVVAHPWFIGAELIFCYLDCRNEAGTKAIIQEAWRLGKTVAVPKTESAGRMQFYEINGFSEIQPGTYDIPEPVGAGQDCILPDPARPSLMILPGTVFDLQGRRIGYGGGFYDRYLGTYPYLRKMALGFELQIVEQIPADDTDLKLDWLITEKRSISYENRFT